MAHSETTDRNWLVLEYEGTLPVRVDASVLDEIDAEDDMLLLSVGEACVALTMLGDPSMPHR